MVVLAERLDDQRRQAACGRQARLKSPRASRSAWSRSPPAAQCANRDADRCAPSPKSCRLGAPSRRLQIFSGARRIMQDIAFAVDDHIGRREALQHPALDGLPQIARHRGPAARAHRGAIGRLPSLRRESSKSQRRPVVIAALENPLLFLDRQEQVGKLADVLGSTEKQVAARPQRKMKHRDDLVCNSVPK